MTMSALPDEALRAVSRIESMLDEANRLIDASGSTDEAAFALRETERRYLPDTLDAYLTIPLSRRDALAGELLAGQLALLERATADRLAALAGAQNARLAANGAFLAERFSDVPAAPAATTGLAATGDATLQPAAGVTAPRALVARLFSDLAPAVRSEPAGLLQLAGQRFSTVFPALTTVRRGPFGGPVKAVAIDVPRGSDVLRYSLERERSGIAAACTKIVRGVALRTERVELAEWLGGLLEDMTAYVERDRSTYALLTKFLAG